MARDRLRDPGLIERQRTQARIGSDVGIGGRVKVGNVGGTGGGIAGTTPPVIGGRGNRIEHVTLHAEASQTIASGGAGVSWDRIASAPTEIRGFASLVDELADTGAVVAIPIDVTGVLNFILEGRWASWRATGDLTVVKTATDGSTEQRAYTLDRNGIATRAFGGDDDGWEVDAGDTIAYQLPNGSGSDQTLATATLVQKVLEVASPTSKPTLIETMWLDEQQNGTSNHVVSTTTLQSGVTYTLRVYGNSNVLPDSFGAMDADADDIIFASDTPGNTRTLAGWDYAYCYSREAGYSASSIPALRTSDSNTAPGGGYHLIDLGSGGQRIAPVGGWPASPASDHRYEIEVTGQGQPLEIWTTDGASDPSVLADNNGQYRYELHRGSV